MSTLHLWAMLLKRSLARLSMVSTFPNTSIQVSRRCGKVLEMLVGLGRRFSGTWTGFGGLPRSPLSGLPSPLNRCVRSCQSRQNSALAISYEDYSVP